MELIDLLKKYETHDEKQILKYIREMINYIIIEKQNNSNFSEEEKLKNIIYLYEFCRSIERLTNKRIKREELLEKIKNKFLVQELPEDITKARKQLYQYLLQIVEVNIIPTDDLQLEQVIHMIRDTMYINSYINEKPDIKTFNEELRKIRMTMKTTDFIVFKGVYNYEFNSEKSIYKVFTHDKFNNQIEKYIIREILHEVKDDSLEKAQDDSESWVANRIFTSLQKDKMIAKFLTKSYKIINRLEEYNYNGKSVDMLHFIEDNLEFYSKAKEILKEEINRQNFEYEEIIMQAEREANSIKNSKELKKITDSDIDRILEKMRLMLTQNGKIALKGILQKEERQERFKDLIFKAFQVESKNICQLRYEVEKSLNDTKTLNEIRKELNSQIDLLIKK
jgi:hypothetical protein